MGHIGLRGGARCSHPSANANRTRARTILTGRKNFLCSQNKRERDTAFPACQAQLIHIYRGNCGRRLQFRKWLHIPAPRIIWYAVSFDATQILLFNTWPEYLIFLVSIRFEQSCYSSANRRHMHVGIFFCSRYYTMMISKICITISTPTVVIKLK